MGSYRFAVSVMPKEGILDPQGRAVETSLPHLGVDSVHGVRVGRRVELSVDAADAPRPGRSSSGWPESSSPTP